MTSAEMLNHLCAEVAEANQKWWQDLYTGEPIQRNVGEMLMLVTSELSEALEGHRKSLMDDKLPQYRMFDVEIVDALIRLFDIAGHITPANVGEIYQAKMDFNRVRKDHQVENRRLPGGKAY